MQASVPAYAHTLFATCCWMECEHLMGHGVKKLRASSSVMRQPCAGCVSRSARGARVHRSTQGARTTQYDVRIQRRTLRSFATCSFVYTVLEAA